MGNNRAAVTQRNRLGRPPKTELRRVVNALLYMMRTGCQWRQLPREFPPYTTVQHYFYDWRDSGVWSGLISSCYCKLAKRPDASQAPRLALLIANRSRPPRPAARAVSMRQRKSAAATGMSSPIQPACWSEPKCIRPTCKTVTVLRSSSPPFTMSFHGCDISSPTAPMRVTSCSISSPIRQLDDRDRASHG
jgi:transposase